MSCKKGANWTSEETKEFLELCKINKITSLMDGKQLKHLDIFRSLEQNMTLKNFHKTGEQMKLKLKNLKLAYYKCKTANNKNGAGRNTCPFYEELDTLYGSRPNAEAMDSSSGVDTAQVSTGVDTANDDSLELTSDLPDDSEQESGSQSSIGETPKKKRQRNFSGRNSYQSMLDGYNKKWMESQEQILKNIMEVQNRQQEEMLQKELENQRKWEAELMAKEQQFQREQTSLMMQTFLQCMQGMRSPNPQPEPQTLMKIIPMKRSANSTFTSVSTSNLVSAPGTSGGTPVFTPILSESNQTVSQYQILSGANSKVLSAQNNSQLRPLKTIRLIKKPQ